ncbi:hypothetical protein Drose_21820 [Dactylosporangium roseum]|uniref:Glycosyltransferase RgtA/B/C/D-like domain-containing protein n=1 Tax=Dactylosporangium roseum TaxID=47989 RepID=A0ABY5YVX7_9ACTN|nr:hypothetical protein [Dactylosporangium roseum]UWZ33906.1 hypothetical protein Drose_21820 [Dactylosporangium roseum]
MTTVLAALALLVVVGLPLAYAFTRSRPLSLVLSPLTGAVTVAAAVLPMLWIGGALWAYLPTAFVGTVLLAWHLRRRPPVPHGSSLSAALLTVPLLFPFLTAFRAPNGWDAHAIWWLHAGMYLEGADYTREVMGNPAMVFTHPDYPPLNSSAVALAWGVLDTRDFLAAQFVSSAVTGASIAMLVYAVRVVTAAAPPPLSWSGSIAAGLSVWFPTYTSPASGLSDAMCAAAFTAGAVLLLFARDPFDTRVLPVTLLLLGSAALMKNEGLSLVGVLAVVATVRHRRAWRRAAWGWLPFAAGVVWSLTTRAFGAKTDVLSAGGFGRLLKGDPDILRRLGPVGTTLWGIADGVVLFAAGGALLGLLLLRKRRRALGLGADPWLWLVLGGYSAILTLIYLATPYDLAWHLATSADRVLIPVAAMACASAACWIVVALSPARRPDPAPGSVAAEPHLVSAAAHP